MIIPWQELTPDTLRNVIEYFVLREGTDYGEQEITFEDKVQQVYDKLRTKQAILMYSELHETVTIKLLTENSPQPKCSYSLT